MIAVAAIGLVLFAVASVSAMTYYGGRLDRQERSQEKLRTELAEVKQQAGIPEVLAPTPSKAVSSRGKAGVAGQPGQAGAGGKAGQQGVEGPEGVPGADGAAGAPGAQGPSGVDGNTGPAGAQGSPGADGQPGAAGSTGKDGAAGPAGAAGATGATGATGPAGATGPQGPSGMASCANGDCLSLQTGGTTTPEVGSISVTGDVTVGGTVTGDGAGLTGVDATLFGGQSASSYRDASNIDSGTLSTSRLSSDVVLKGSANTFTGANTFASIAATSIAQAGNEVCDDSNNCDYAASSELDTVIKQGGNSFGAQATIGTNDSQALALTAGGTERLKFGAATQAVMEPASALAGTTLDVRTPSAGGSKSGLRVGNEGLNRYLTLGYANSSSPFSPSSAAMAGFLTGPGGFLVSDSNLAVSSTNAADPALIVRGVGSQSGGLLALRGSDNSNRLVVDANGNTTIYGSTTLNGGYLALSANTRGAVKPVTAGDTSLTYVHNSPYPNTTYGVLCTPNWDTTCWVSARSTTSFTLSFGTAAPADATVDWIVVR